MSRSVLAVAALAAALYVWHLDRPGYSDTEGMFAEPAREMVVTGDWVTPRMNGEPFLTKPPLAYWLAASVMAVAGPTEWARLWCAGAAAALVVVTGALGTELFDPAAGVVSALVVATMAGTFIEAHFLRADVFLVLAVTAALLCYVRARRDDRRARIALWATIGLGILDKGLLAIALPACAIGVAEIATGELRPATLGRRLRALGVVPGLLVVAAVAVPWHVAAGLRNPGFLWDYVVNQHLLFFFDEKLPRDSIPDSLGFFWTMFVVRGLPWSLFVPAAVVHAWRRRTDLPGVALVAGWLTVVLALFSCAAGRLEHYSMPALPAVALLVGLALADAARGDLRVGRAWLVVPALVAGGAALAVATQRPEGLLAALDPDLSASALVPLVRPALVGFGSALLAAAAFAAFRRAGLATAAVLSGAVAVLVCVQLAHERVEPLFSWRPFAAAVRRDAPEARVFFRAEDEYQLCGGLDYYLRRNVALLAPPGWVPPTFLAGRTDRLFTPRAELIEAWAHGDAILVADDVAGPADEARLAPGPYAVALRAGERVLLRSGDRLAGGPNAPTP